jgi:hypothetical protein
MNFKVGDVVVCVFSPSFMPVNSFTIGKKYTVEKSDLSSMGVVRTNDGTDAFCMDTFSAYIYFEHSVEQYKTEEEYYVWLAGQRL